MKTIINLLGAGVLSTVAASALADVRYVDVNSTNATPPYTNWATAATNIQDAVDAAVAGDEVVVTNGTYYPVGVGKPLNIRSVNGPQSTTISGGRTDQCAYLTSGATLSGFRLRDGFNSGSGAGVYCESRTSVVSNCIVAGNRIFGYGGGAFGGTLNNCTLIGNEAINPNSYAGDARGGGAYQCTLNNCILNNNSAESAFFGGLPDGGGAYQCTLNNCIVTGNSAYHGGGVADCTLNNCIVYFNTGENYTYSTVNYCCTIPQPYPGIGNITNAPLFVDTNGWANLRLQPNSPCINAGNNSYVTNATDLDGNPRISGGTVDIGAYEFQWPQLTITRSGVPPSGIILSWPTNNAGYDYTGFILQSTTNLVSLSVWTTNSPAPVVIGGQNTVTNPITGPQQFYRLVQ